MRVPDCAWMKLSFYAISESTGLTIVVFVEGQFELSEELFALSDKSACDTLNTMGQCDDARPMTAEEVKNYMESDDVKDSVVEDDNFYNELLDDPAD